MICSINVRVRNGVLHLSYTDNQTEIDLGYWLESIGEERECLDELAGQLRDAADALDSYLNGETQ